MKSNRVERLLKTIAVLVTFAILLATVSGQAVKNSDTAAWLSMIFNGVMATAAVGAFLTARKWLPQLTMQEGYREAITLVNELILPLEDWESMYGCLMRLDQTSNTLHQGGQPRYNRQLEFSQLETAFEKLNKKTESIRLQFRRLATFGLAGSARYEKQLVELENAYRSTLKTAERLEERLREDFHLHSQYQAVREQYSYINNASKRNQVQASKVTWGASANLVKDAWDIFDESYNRTMEIYKKLFDDRPTVAELFEVRK
ncbi:hypothetical protein [Enterobacter sp. KBR-315C3_2022]|uniref:hypothetical protein n=1 Tax=Enterobacter sp. KBR-315C3_2022 TaxID=3242494 RepID=UPI00352956D5